MSTVSRIEGASRLTAIVTVLIACLFGAQALGFDLNNLLAVGGISGLAIGLAGREILGNVFMGLMLYATQPFSPGEHVKFSTPSQKDIIDGLVVDVGLFRTTVRSFEREMFLIPNRCALRRCACRGVPGALLHGFLFRCVRMHSGADEVRVLLLVA
jgi:hypothetical protein